MSEAPGTAAAKPARQFGMVIDLNKCIGCQTCTVACKQQWTNTPGTASMWWNIVNTMPGEGTPKNWEKMGGGWKDGVLQYGSLPEPDDFGRAWEFNHAEVFYGGKGTTTHLRPLGPTPAQKPAWGPNWDEDRGAGEYPNGYYFYLPRLCNHCAKPACVAACPVQAISKRAEDGIVLIDEDKCRGNRLCQRACPYKRIYHDHERHVSQKCIACLPRLEQGVAPACVRQCPARARHVGFLDDPDGHLHALIHRWKVALPLHPEFGTEPSVYYIPPVGPARLDANGDIDENTPRIPPEYLASLFGPGAQAAIETIRSERERCRRGEYSALIDILISRRWADMLGPFAGSPAAADITLSAAATARNR